MMSMERKSNMGFRCPIAKSNCLIMDAAWTQYLKYLYLYTSFIPKAIYLSDSI